MSVTLPIFKERVAQKLGVLPVGNSLSPEDGRLIGEHCDSVQKKLSALELAEIDFDDGIDDTYSDVIVAMVASTLVDEFQLEEPKRTRIAAEGALGLPVASPAERQLRKILAPTRVSRPVQTDYF